MDREKVKQLMDACYYGKRIPELMADLPEHMKPRHIHVVDAVYSMKMKGIRATVSDVSERLNVTMPSVTKLIGELEGLKVLEKHRDLLDKRNVYVVLTPLGEKYHKFYVEDYLDWLGEVLSVVSVEEVDVTIATLQKIYGIMKKQKQEAPLEYSEE